MAATYSEKLATQLIGSHNGTLNAVQRHCWHECERIANGFASAENEWGVELYSGICDHLYGEAH